MKHPEIFLVPALMFADYFLTVLGAREREKQHALHFKMENYELNPVWQESIRGKKWFNLRHTILTVVMTAILIWIFEFGDVPDGYVQGLLGLLFSALGMIVGRHLSNLFIFRYVVNHPQQISGEITMSHQFVLRTSLYQTITVLVPIVMIALFSRSDFATGAVAGIALLFCVHLLWIFKANRKQAAAGKRT